MNILITGGTGSFGRAFTKRLLNLDAERIVILSRDEVKQADMAEAFAPHKSRMRFFIGDVRDRDRLRRAFEGVDIVIHAAALKRIEVGNYNPGEMVKTNILGAMNVIEAAQDARVRKVVALSTDKAFQPISPYGQSKALAESLFLNANNCSGEGGPEFAVTRYGNVAFSRGSVIPKWKEIIAGGHPVPVTDPRCTRFWMTMEQACDLVFEAMVHMPKKILIPTLCAYTLRDLAKAMGAIDMTYTGLPDYEKMHESLDADHCSELAPRLTVAELQSFLHGDLPEHRTARNAT